MVQEGPKKVTIIVIAHNSIPYIVHTIDSIMENTRYPHRILIIESESTDGTDQYCDWLANKHEHIRVIHTKREGVIKAFNRGLKEVKEGDVVLTHDDVIFPKLYERDWLYMFVRYRDELKDVGLLTSLNGGGRSGPEFSDKFMWAGTWTLYIPRETLDKLKYYEEI